MLLPWQARSERQALIAAATAEKERSQAGAARAEVIRQDILRLAEENNWAARLASVHRNGEGR